MATRRSTSRDPITEVRQALKAAGLKLAARPRKPAPRKLGAKDRLPEAIAARIDHTVLKPDATRASITSLCAEANAFRFASVCVNPVWVKHAARALDGIDACTVIGFPLGASSPAAKAREARQAVRDGATELDMVLQVGALREAVPEQSGAAIDGELGQLVLDDMAGVVEASSGRLVKVILETCLLSRRQKIAACVLAATAGVDFVKTSTGFSTGGATAADVRLMRSVVGASIGVKASGGIRNRADALTMLRAGADRLGCSSSLAIVGAD